VKASKTTTLAVFGSVDGLVMFMGVVFGILVSHHGASAAWHAALGGATGELVGMTAGQHESDPEAGWKTAVMCGVAGAVACVLPGVPFAVTSGRTALIWAAGIAIVVAAAICWLRPQRGLEAVSKTYGVLAVAAVLSGLSGLI
jgi:hypothetical protein